MGILPMVEKARPFLNADAWPLFYMNDFSVIGLAVTQLPSAIEALKARGYEIIENSNGALIRFEGARQMIQAIEILQNLNIPFDLTDLIDHVYQG